MNTATVETTFCVFGNLGTISVKTRFVRSGDSFFMRTGNNNIHSDWKRLFAIRLLDGELLLRLPDSLSLLIRPREEFRAPPSSRATTVSTVTHVLLIIYFDYVSELSQAPSANHKEVLFQMQSSVSKYWTDIFSSENSFTWVDTSHLEIDAKEVSNFIS